MVLPWNKTRQGKRKEIRKKASHLTMMVIPHTHGTAVRNYCLPMWAVQGFLALSLICIVTVGYFIGGYFYLNYLATENKELKEVNVAQAVEIKELKGLAGTMKAKLEDLIKLDQEVRAKVGLTKSLTDTGNGRAIDSSRSLERYQFMTMGLGSDGSAPSALISRSVPENILLLQPQSDSFMMSERPSSNSEDPQPSELVDLSDEEEIDTLEVLKEQLAKMDELLTLQAENMNQLNKDVDSKIAFDKAYPNSWPYNGRLTSTFGWRKNPFTHRGSEFHDGIDLAGSYGAAIKAAGDGVVTFSGYRSGWGNLVMISHGYGYVTQYAHNSSILVKNGTRVTKGQVIARLGSSGRATGPHLHFGIAKNGQWINPLTILKR